MIEFKISKRKFLENSVGESTKKRRHAAIRHGKSKATCLRLFKAVPISLILFVFFSFSLLFYLSIRCHVFCFWRWCLCWYYQPKGESFPRFDRSSWDFDIWVLFGWGVYRRVLLIFLQFACVENLIDRLIEGWLVGTFYLFFYQFGWSLKITCSIRLHAADLWDLCWFHHLRVCIITKQKKKNVLHTVYC